MPIESGAPLDAVMQSDTGNNHLIGVISPNDITAPVLLQAKQLENATIRQIPAEMLSDSGENEHVE